MLSAHSTHVEKVNEALFNIMVGCVTNVILGGLGSWEVWCGCVWWGGVLKSVG